MIVSSAGVYEYKERIKKTGITKYTRMTNKMFVRKSFKLLQLAYIGDEELDENGNLNITDEPKVIDDCESYSYEGAFEYFKGKLYEDAREVILDLEIDSSDISIKMYNTDDDNIRLVVLSIADLHTENYFVYEYYITTAYNYEINISGNTESRNIKHW